MLESAYTRLMPSRPLAAIQMSAALQPTVFDDSLLDRLRTTVELGPLGAGTEILITGWGCPVIGDATLDGLPKLRAVVHAAGTVKGHVREAVWRRGIAVSSAADANAEPVADYTLAMIILAGKRSLFYAKRYAAGQIRSLAHGTGDGNDGLTVGVVGASRIGRRVIERLERLGYYRVLVSDPYVPGSMDLDDLCRESDVVTLHAPALPSTRHMIDDRRLGLMRDGAVLINTARGSLVDTDALVRHCSAGRIDAVLDVTEPEPLPAGHPLFALPNVIVTPHLAGAQGRERLRLGEFAISEVERFVRGEPLRGAVLLEDLGRLA
jgi:phosphoglycerate dehydrogenase-like enzyme